LAQLRSYFRERIHSAMKLSAENTFLVKKQLQQAIGPLEIFAGGAVSTIAFVICFSSLASSLRATQISMAVLAVASMVGAAVATSYVGIVKARQRKAARHWLCGAIALWAGICIGSASGNNYWYIGYGQYEAYQEMASYVNIDPSLDKAGSYMDAASLYFQQGTFVDSSAALAFRNGLTYCIAPIVKEPLQGNSNSSKTSSGFNIPKSGTIDFWAVGTDCCGTSGTPFNCGDLGDSQAYSVSAGLRLLDDQERPMYQLAVQEWTSTTGLASKHPMFLIWLQDPLDKQQQLKNVANNALTWLSAVYFLVATFITYLLHMFFRHWKFL